MLICRYLLIVSYYSTWDATCEGKIWVENSGPQYTVVAKTRHIPYTHLILIEAGYQPIPIHDTIWTVFFSNIPLSRSPYFPYAVYDSQQVPVVDLRGIVPREPMYAFIEYMYTPDQEYLDRAWLGLCSEEKVQSMSQTRLIKLFQSSLKQTNIFKWMAKEWGVRDVLLHNDLDQFLYSFCEPWPILTVCTMRTDYTHTLRALNHIF